MMLGRVAPQVAFSVIVPTAGRLTLRYALESIVSQVEPGDEVFVIRDETGDWGHSARDEAIARATGTHLVFMDDDDEFFAGALATMRRFAEQQEGRIGIFRERRVLYGHGGEIRRVTEMWHERDLDQTATPCTAFRTSRASWAASTVTSRTSGVATSPSSARRSRFRASPSGERSARSS